MLKALMIPMFHDMKSLNKLNTFGTLNCGGNEIESSEFITDCNALFVAGVQTALAAAEVSPALPAVRADTSAPVGKLTYTASTTRQPGAASAAPARDTADYKET